MSGVHDQGADQRHALAHAAGQHLGIGVFETRQPELLEIFARLALGLGAIDAARLEPEQHIAEHGAPGKQQVLLHHVADAAAQAVDLLAEILHRAGVRLDQAGDDVEDRGFAATARPDDADKIAGVDVKGQIFEHADFAALAAEGFSNALRTLNWDWSGLHRTS